MKTRHWRQAQGSRSISDPESREVGTARQSWCWVHNFNLGPFQGVREARSLHAGSEDSAWAPLEQGSRARTQAGPSIHDGGLHCTTGPFTCRIFNPEKNIRRKAPLSFFVGEEAEVRSEVSCLRAHRRQLAEYRCKSKDRSVFHPPALCCLPAVSAQKRYHFLSTPSSLPACAKMAF